jgi:hypothetical protein
MTSTLESLWNFAVVVADGGPKKHVEALKARARVIAAQAILSLDAPHSDTLPGIDSQPGTNAVIEQAMAVMRGQGDDGIVANFCAIYGAMQDQSNIPEHMQDVYHRLSNIKYRIDRIANYVNIQGVGLDTDNNRLSWCHSAFRDTKIILHNKLIVAIEDLNRN